MGCRLEEMAAVCALPRSSGLSCSSLLASNVSVMLEALFSLVCQCHTYSVSHFFPAEYAHSASMVAALGDTKLGVASQEHPRASAGAQMAGCVQEGGPVRGHGLQPVHEAAVRAGDDALRPHLLPRLLCALHGPLQPLPHVQNGAGRSPYTSDGLIYMPGSLATALEAAVERNTHSFAMMHQHEGGVTVCVRKGDSHAHRCCMRAGS